MPLPGSLRRLPTVEMYHKKLGITRIVNATVYAAEYLCNPNWTTQSPNVSGYREGTVKKIEVLEDKREHELNKFRLEDPDEARKRGDRERAFKEGSMVAHNIVIDGKIDPDWRGMPWFKCRAYIKELTGVIPKNKVHAEELMKDG